jgi:Flp pilus assembly pilin Flp
MVEYGLLLSFIVALALAVVTSLRGQLITIWSGVSSAVSTAAS